MSPMNNRLMRPRASGGAKDADARAYIAAVELADGQKLEPAVVKAIDDFVIGCKADGIWTALKASCILMGARTLSGALTPLAGTAPTNVNNNFISTDYNRKTGLLGNASNKSINTNRAGNADGQDDKHLACYASTAAAAGGNGAFIGSSDNTDNETLKGRSDILGGFGTFSFYLHSQAQGLFVASTESPGFIGMSRASSSQFTRRVGGSSVSGSSTSNPPNSSLLHVLARGRETGTPDAHSSHRIAFYSIGSSLTLATLDARVSALYNAIGAAI